MAITFGIARFLYQRKDLPASVSAVGESLSRSEVSRQRPSRKMGIGRPLADRTSWWGPKPSLRNTVAARSSRRAGILAGRHSPLVRGTEDGTAGIPRRPAVRPSTAPSDRARPCRLPEVSGRIPGAHDDGLIEQAVIQGRESGQSSCSVQGRRRRSRRAGVGRRCAVPSRHAKRHEAGRRPRSAAGGKCPLSKRRPAVVVSQPDPAHAPGRCGPDAGRCANSRDCDGNGRGPHGLGRLERA